MKGSVEIQGYANEKINGTVAFHVPTHYEKIAIGRRIAELSSPYRWEDLPAQERGEVRLIATLEHVIDTAPAGFYSQGPGGQPVLDLGNFLEGDSEALWEVFAAYTKLLESFRETRVPRPGSAETSGSSGVVEDGSAAGGKSAKGAGGSR